MSDQRIQVINQALREMDERQLTGELSWQDYRQQRAQLFYQLQIVVLTQDDDITQLNFQHNTPPPAPVADFMPHAQTSNADNKYDLWPVLTIAVVASAVVLLLIVWAI